MVGKIILTKDKIIKVNNCSFGKLTGYNVITEQLETIDMSDKYIEAGESVFGLMKNEINRYKVAFCMTEKESDTAEMLGIQERTCYRLKKQVNCK